MGQVCSTNSSKLKKHNHDNEFSSASTASKEKSESGSTRNLKKKTLKDQKRGSGILADIVTSKKEEEDESPKNKNLGSDKNINSLKEINFKKGKIRKHKESDSSFEVPVVNHIVLIPNFN